MYPVCFDVPNENNRPRSIKELAKMLQKGEIDPALLEKEVIEQIAMYLKLEGLPDDLIGSFIHKDPRTIRRYLRNAKRKNRMSKFEQADYIDDLISSFQEQRMRVSKYAYSDDIKPGDAIRAMHLVHCIDMDQFEVLARFGFINKHQVQVDAAQEAKKQKPPKLDDQEWLDSQKLLSGTQKERVLQFMDERIEELMEEVAKAEQQGMAEAKAMMREIIAEKERRIKLAKEAECPQPAAEDVKVAEQQQPAVEEVKVAGQEQPVSEEVKVAEPQPQQPVAEEVNAAEPQQPVAEDVKVAGQPPQPAVAEEAEKPQNKGQSAYDLKVKAAEEKRAEIFRKMEAENKRSQQDVQPGFDIT